MRDEPTLVFEQGDLAVRRIDCAFPIPPELGQHLLSHGVYATGNDFTNYFAESNPDYQGNSLLRQLWEGYEGRATEGVEHTTLWLVEQEGTPQGVVVWLRTDQADGTPTRHVDEVPTHPNHHPKARLPCAPLGKVMCYLDKSLRGQGVIRRIMAEGVVPELDVLARTAHAAGAMPFVSSTDATTALLRPLTDVPVVEHFTDCRALREDLWRYRRDVRMHPEDPGRHAKFVVEPEPIPGRQRKPRR